MMIDKELHSWGSIARYLFGVNATKQTGAEAKLLAEGRRCLIITDSGVEQAGLIDGVKASLEKGGFQVNVCAKVEPEPTLTSYQAIVDIVREVEADILVGLGGGSSMDSAKAAGRAIRMTEPLQGYLCAPLPVEEGIPVITIPTTSGTGAEVTQAAVVRPKGEYIKYWFDNCMANTAIIDPTLMLNLPPSLTARTGIDALAHAIESQLSKLSTPHTRALAIESVRMIPANLRKAVSNGTDLEARNNMAWATLIAAFSEGIAYDIEGHWLGHIIGPYYGISHGEACGIMLPYTMEFNLPFADIEVMARIGMAMDEQAIEKPPLKAAEMGILAVKKLMENIGLPVRLADVKDTNRKDIPEIVGLYQDNLAEDMSIFCPHPATSGELIKLLESVFDGVLISKL